MKRFLLCVICLLWLSPALRAQELSALARVDPSASGITDGWFGRTDIALHLSQGVPFRVFTLDDPARLVVDFREIDFDGLRAAAFLNDSTRINSVRFGAFQPGWSRLVADLAEPALPREIGMPVDVNSDRDLANLSDPVLDPGHGGIDPGAERDGVNEKQLMLSLAQTLADVLRRAGVEVVMTREEDVFVALETRVATAHQVQGDLFISLHADNLSQGGAKGATVYLLSEEASDSATEHLAARHNRSDIIAGADLTGSDDQVAQVLLDLARQETEPRSVALAEQLIAAMTAAGGPMNRRPLRKAGFSVLKSADIPSVLIEIGFLSSDRDLANLSDPVWRQGMARGVAQGILAWRDADAARTGLLRQ